jgi:hypothetical protein
MSEMRDFSAGGSGPFNGYPPVVDLPGDRQRAVDEQMLSDAGYSGERHAVSNLSAGDFAQVMGQRFHR